MFKTIFSGRNKIRGGTKNCLPGTDPECPHPPWLLACFEVVSFLPICTRRNGKTMKNWWGVQMIKVGYLHDRQLTLNNFMGKEKEANLSADTFVVDLISF